ncbi:hypothetical protein BH20BAC1_BH20BAC1_24300 [soil metagenome]
MFKRIISYILLATGVVLIGFFRNYHGNLISNSGVWYFLSFILSLLGFLIIPAFITAGYLKDKSVLNVTLDYLYSPDHTKQYSTNFSRRFLFRQSYKNHAVKSFKKPECIFFEFFVKISANNR